jgi:hypothetical protein
VAPYSSTRAHRSSVAGQQHVRSAIISGMRPSRILSTLPVVILSVLVAACGGAAPSPSAAAGTEACTPVSVTGPDGQPIDLSGAWSGNDGGIYYMKQIDSCLWWSALSSFEGQPPGDAWVMTFKGQVRADKTIHGEFVDVKSNNPGSGTMTIQIDAQQSDSGVAVYLHRTETTGHEIGVTFWQRALTQPTASPSESPGGSAPASSTGSTPAGTQTPVPSTTGSP